MKLAIVAAALAGLAYSQNLPNVPDCTQPCLIDAIHSDTSCDVTDTQCICLSLDSIKQLSASGVIDSFGGQVTEGMIASQFCMEKLSIELTSLVFRASVACT
jgi:hypothetical protein